MTNAIAKFNRDLVLAGPVGSLDAYIQAVGTIPVLSKEDEQALATRFREEEDLAETGGQRLFVLLGQHRNRTDGLNIGIEAAYQGPASTRSRLNFAIAFVFNCLQVGT